MTHFINLVIDRGVFFNKRICLSQVGFGLVIIVIADKIAYRVIGEKSFKLIVKLSREGFIMSQYQGWFLYPFDDIGDGKGFPRTCYSQKGLLAWGVAQALHQFIYGLGLISSRFVVGLNFKRLHGAD